jgi:hypothetical protein
MMCSACNSAVSSLFTTRFQGEHVESKQAQWLPQGRVMARRRPPQRSGGGALEMGKFYKPHAEQLDEKTCETCET